MKCFVIPILVALAAAAAAQEAAEPAEATSPEPAAAVEPAKPALATPEADIVGLKGPPAPAAIPNAPALTSSEILTLPSRRVTSIEPNRWIELDRRRYGGLLGEAFATPQPWQFLNPLAPAAYGDGTRYLRQDPYTGRGEGVILFSIRLPGSGGSKSLAASRAKKAAKAREE